MKNGVRSERLLELYQIIQAPPEIVRYNLEDIPQEKVDVSCWGCRIVVPTFFLYRRNLQMSDEDCEKSLIDLCINIKAASPHVCRGLIKINIEPILFVLDNQPKLTPNIFCAFAFQGSCGVINEPEFDYSITVDTNFTEPQVSILE